MSVGVVVNVPSGTAHQYRVPSGYQAPSITVLNPNDGVVYIARNRDASVGTTAGWDYKVPSQSYASLPGPYITAGVYYLDQSGSNRAGEISIYDITQKLSIPMFSAIGRAVQQTGSAVDISQGGQPANPPAGSSRLWVDSNNHLHILDPSGNSYLVVDQNNAPVIINPLIDSRPLGGDLTGTVSNGHVNVVAGSTLNVASGSTMNMSGIIAFPTGGTIADGGSGYVAVQSNMTCNNFATANLNVNGPASLNGPTNTFHGTTNIDSLIATNAPTGYGLANAYPSTRVNLSWAQQDLTVDTGMSGGLVAIVGATLSSAGIWLVTGTVTLQNTSAGTNGLIAYFYNSTQGVYYGGGAFISPIAAGAYASASLNTIVNVPAAANIYVSVAVTALPAVVKAHEALSNPAGGFLTGIRAVRIA